MKKIAFYIESWVCGGAEKQLIDLVNHMDLSEYDITIISIYKKSVYNNYTFQLNDQIKPGIKLKYLVNNENPFIYRLFNHAYAHMNKKTISRILIKDHYDYEIAYYEGLPTVFVANSYNSDSKKFAWLHTDNHKLYKEATVVDINKTKKIYSSFHCVVGVSERTEQSFKTYFPDIKTCTIRNGLDLDLIDRKYEEECPLPDFEEVTFLSVGRLTQAKGYMRLLEVFKQLYSEGYRFVLVLVGDGIEKSSLISYVQSNKLQDIIYFAGPQTNPYKYMKHADFYICSSYYEGFGLTVAEAIACSLPVLVTDCVSTVLGNENCGLICDNSKNGIYEMLKNVLDKKVDSADFVDGCKKRRKELSINQTIEAIEQLLQGELQ